MTGFVVAAALGVAAGSADLRQLHGQGLPRAIRPPSNSGFQATSPPWGSHPPSSAAARPHPPAAEHHAPSSRYDPPASVPAPNRYAPAAPAAPPLPRGDEPVAIVGPEVILMSDVAPQVDHILRTRGKDIPAEQREQVRMQLILQRLSGLINSKRLIVAMRQKVPKENWKLIEETFRDGFEKKEIKSLMKRMKVNSRQELVQKIESSMGITFQEFRNSYLEQGMAQQWLMQETSGKDEEISHAELVDYYRRHAKDYEFPAKVRWQQLSIEYGGKRTRAQAHAELYRWANLIVREVMTFAQAAQRFSEGTTASQGGMRDWTPQGSLVYENIDRALFALPAGQLSPIIDDGGMLHIVLVLERRAAGKTPFHEAAAEIKEKLEKERRSQRRKDYLAELKTKIQVRNLLKERLAQTGIKRK